MHFIRSPKEFGGTVVSCKNAVNDAARLQYKILRGTLQRLRTFLTGQRCPIKLPAGEASARLICKGMDQLSLTQHLCLGSVYQLRSLYFRISIPIALV